MSPDNLSDRSLLFLAKGSGKCQASKIETFRCKEPYFSSTPKKTLSYHPHSYHAKKNGKPGLVPCETVTTCPTTP